jgi:hypothetical protein
MPVQLLAAKMLARQQIGGVDPGVTMNSTAFRPDGQTPYRERTRRSTRGMLDF